MQVGICFYHGGQSLPVVTTSALGISRTLLTSTKPISTVTQLTPYKVGEKWIETHYINCFITVKVVKRWMISLLYVAYVLPKV
jgi:hypothetical protein